jgi:hypothetical protein
MWFIQLVVITFLVSLFPKFDSDADKQVIAVQALFEEESAIDSIWQKVLALENVSCARTYGARPHMTIASFKLTEDEFDSISDEFRKLDKEYPSHKFRVELSVRQRGDNYSYYLVPESQDTVLTRIHDALYLNVDNGFERYRKIDVPGSWWPHISMFGIHSDSTSIPDEVFKEIENIETVTLKGFSLVGFGPVKYFNEIETRPAN